MSGHTETPPADTRRAFRLANELCAELQRCEHREVDRIDDVIRANEAPPTSADVTHLNEIRKARDFAVEARDILGARQP